VSGTNPRLVVVRGEDRGQELELDVAGEVRVGRGRSADFSLSDPSVSRHHVTLIYDGRGVRARDEGSGNGTLKNGVPLEGEAALVDGDELELGETAIKLVHPSARVIVDSAPAPRVERRVPPRNLRPLVLAGAAALVLLTLGIVAASFLLRPSLAPAPPPVAAAPPPAATQQPIVVTQLPAEPAPAAAVPAPASPARRKPPAATPSSSSPAPPARRPDEPKVPSAARAAQQLYEDKDFSGAARSARDAAERGGPDTDALLELARDYAAVGAGITRGDANADSSPTVALTAYQDALAADVRSGRSVHSTMIRAKLAKVAPAAAHAFYDVGRYEAARAACDMAVNYNVGGDPRVAETRKLLEDAASELFRRAQALRSKDAAEAEHLFRRILQIVPPMSPWAGKALAALKE